MNMIHTTQNGLYELMTHDKYVTATPANEASLRVLGIATRILLWNVLLVVNHIMNLIILP